MHTAEQLRIEQIRAIYRNSVPGDLTILVAVVLLMSGLAYIHAATPRQHTLFLLMVLVQAAGRLALMHAYSRGGRERTNWRPWALWFTVSSFVYGLTFGAGSLWMV